MNLLLQRTTKTLKATEGKLFIGNDFQCFTLEPVFREEANVPVAAWKVFGSTAIPVGTYAVEVTFFHREGYYSPLLDNVPGFAGVRIHIGNFPKDTEGCILVGTEAGQDQVLNSKLAFTALMTKIDAARKNNEPIQIKVENDWVTQI
ncbi:hypothetical protein AWB71_04162 [Caballeronia peredens]|nr:hypothetical protein AWB71_04162 [Caballeronia peredens]